MRPEIIFPSICPCFPNFFFFFFALKNNMFYYYQEWPAWGGGCTGLRVCVRCEGQMIIGRLKEREWGWRPGPKAPPIYFWEEVDLIKESWQARARPPIRLRNSWKSSCPSELRSSFFIMRSRSPGSFWFFVKAPSSVFMKIRNSALESLLLLPSLPACLWKTAIRGSMHRSVSVGLDIFAMFGEERSTGLRAKSGEAWTPQFLMSVCYLKRKKALN